MMQNRMSREILYDSIKMSEDELYHHGVLGMSWGDRNGPPYPLSGSAKKFARAEAKKKIEKEKRLEKMRKLAAKKRKIEAKEAKKQEKIDKMKAKLIEKGDMDKINKKSKYFTNEELEFARERNRQLVETRYTRNAKDAPDPHAMDKLFSFISRAGQIATAAVPMIQVAKGLKEMKKMDLDRDLTEMKSAKEAMEAKIRLIKEFDPEAAAKYASKQLGTTIGYKNPDDKNKMSSKDRIDLLLKIDPDAAAKEVGKLIGNDAVKYKDKMSVKDISSSLSELSKMLGDSSISDDDKEELRKNQVALGKLLKP